MGHGAGWQKTNERPGRSGRGAAGWLGAVRTAQARAARPTHSCLGGGAIQQQVLRARPMYPQPVAQLGLTSPLLAGDEPVAYRSELSTLIRVGWPVGFSSFCRMIMAVTDISVLGHLQGGTEYLAAAAMSYVVMDVTGTFPSTAADALNALCSQAYGAQNYRLVGQWLQIGLIITTLMCVPVMVCWMFTGDILLWLGAPPHIASLANEYAFWSIWGLIPNEVYYAVRQYFQAQGIVLPQLYNNMAFVAVNLVLNVVFVHGIGSWPGLGFVGSAIATSVSRTLQPLVFITYAGAWKGLHRQTWPDTSIVYWFTRRDVAEYFRQTLPTMIGNAIEQWQMEVVTLMAASLGVVDVATQSAVFNVFFALHCFSFGLAKATTCRVGYHLGANHPTNAMRSARVSLLVSVVLGGLVGLALLAMRNVIGHLFSNDPAVWQDMSALMFVLSISYVGVSVLISLESILFGQGRPMPVAVLGCLCTWGMSLPLAYVFAFKWHLYLAGLWTGLSVGYLAFVVVAAVVVYRTDWDECARRAVLRSNGGTHRCQQ